MLTSVIKASGGLGSSSNVGRSGSSIVAGDNGADLFPTNDIDAGDCDEELTLVEKDRIIRSLETEVEAQVIGQN